MAAEAQSDAVAVRTAVQAVVIGGVVALAVRALLKGRTVD